MASFMIPRFHKPSPFLSFTFVGYSGDLIVHLLQGGRGRVSGSEVISCSHLLQYICWNRLCVESVSSRRYVVTGVICRKPSFAQLVFNLSTVSVPVFLFQVDAGTMLYRVDSDVHLKTIEDW